MEDNRNLLSQLTKAYQGLPADRRAIIVICVVVFIAVLVYWISSAAEPEYALLYGDLTMEDSGAIVNELQTRNIPYKLTNGGASVWVPLERRDDARIDLAMGDVLPSGPVGFEIFDKSNIGLTEFTQITQYQRAMQGELERTLRAIDGVEFARVHLNMPEPSPFIGEEEETTASVMLKLSPRYRTIDQMKVAAIQNLVATAVGGLDPSAITIIDDKANLLKKDQAGEDEYAALPDRLAVKRAFEAEETNKIKGILTKRFGPGNVAVGVSVELNFDRIERETKSFTPAEGTTKGVLNKEEIEEEETKGGGGQSAQGVPGTASNVPGYPASGGGEYQSSSSRESKEYSVSEAWEHTIVANGDVEKMSVSVLINAEEEDSALVSEVEQLVLAAANLDQTRGDLVSVKMMPFDTTYLAELDAAMEEEKSKEMMAGLMKWIPTALILLVALVIFLRLLRPIKEGYKVPRVDEVVDEEEVKLPPQDPEALRKVKMREEITNIAESDPASAARIIKTWLSE
jgi:flagellar M-ring protein FliF